MKILRNTLWATGLFCVMTIVGAEGFLTHSKADAFINTMVSEHGFEKKQIQAWLKQGEYLISTKKKLAKPAEKTKTLKQYKPLFVDPLSIERGVAFYTQHQQLLEAAQQRYGVPATIIAAIIGVETRYGRIKGKTNTFNALATTAFSDNRRHDFFERELVALLLICREQNIDPFSLTGSYAGAMGISQFMPSSYRAYAVDFDADGKIDIWNNYADAIGSVGHYLAEHKWDKNEPIVVRARVKNNLIEKPNTGNINSKYALEKVNQLGWQPVEPLVTNYPVYPLKLQGDQGTEFWLGLNNFRSITRYNHSVRYAMTVFFLHESIKYAL